MGTAQKSSAIITVLAVRTQYLHSDTPCVVMALEECVADLVTFRQFLNEWKEELSTKTVSNSAGNEVLTMKFSEYENAGFPFEAFAAQEMGCDIVPELDADCRLVSRLETRSPAVARMSDRTAPVVMVKLTLTLTLNTFINRCLFQFR